MSSACSSAGAALARDQAGWKRTAGSGKAPWKAVEGLYLMAPAAASLRLGSSCAND